MEKSPILIASLFDIDQKPTQFRPFGSGHIHDTWVLSDEKQDLFILQRVNTRVFPDPEAIAENISLVSSHIKAKLARENISDPERHVLSIIPSKKGKAGIWDEAATFWRMFPFIEQTFTVDRAETPQQAYEAARAFGRFQYWLDDMEAARLNTIIPDFHNIQKRYQSFKQAVEADAVGRKKLLTAEITFALEVEYLGDKIASLLARHQLPLRVTHNDTKINNALLDKQTGKGLCVIDLDTLMPGTALYDFGDMIRTFIPSVDEDEKDLSQLAIRMDIFQALAKGYLSHTQAILTDTEKENLVYSGQLLTLLMGIRFLTDYLMGDVYYKIKYPEHNLVRCRNQFALLRELLERKGEMEEMIERIK